MNAFLLNAIIQLLVMEKIKGIGLVLNENKIEKNRLSFVSEEGVYEEVIPSTFGLRKNLNDEKFNLLIENNIIEKAYGLFMYDEECRGVFELKVVSKENSKEYWLNGYEVDPDETDFIYKYKIHKDIVEEGKNIYKKCQRFIDDEKNLFSFTYGKICYKVPLYLLVLENAMSKIKEHNYHSSLLLNMSLSNEEFEKLFKKTDLSALTDAAVSGYSAKEEKWQDTMKF